MALFVEVESVEKNSKVIINLDTVLEVAPLMRGGCELFFPDGAAVNGTRSLKVKDSYELFRQFAMQTVSSDDIAKQVSKLKASAPAKEKLAIPKLGEKASA
jgi:hypothetical protein